MLQANRWKTCVVIYKVSYNDQVNIFGMTNSLDEPYHCDRIGSVDANFASPGRFITTRPDAVAILSPTGAQLSNKAASPLAKSLATALCRNINIGSKIDVDYVAPFTYCMVVITPLFRYSAVEYHVGARNCKLRLT